MAAKKKNGSEITDLKYKNRLNIDKMKSKIEWLRIKKYGSTKNQETSSTHWMYTTMIDCAVVNEYE